MKKPPNQAESDYMDRVRALGCYLCRFRGLFPAVTRAHHLREGAGLSIKNSHYLTVPVCDRHHTDPQDGWHGQRREWKLAGVTEMDALADTIMLLNRGDK